MPLSLDRRRYLSTGEACKLAGISRETFLRWVRQNRFADVENRDRNGWRLFTNKDLDRLKLKVNRIEKIATIRVRSN